MKFWQKAFIILLIIFMVTLDGIMGMMMHYSYKQQLDGVKKRISREAYFINHSLTKDLTSLSSTGAINQNEMKDVQNTYISYYSKQNIKLAFWNEEGFIEDSKGAALTDGIAAVKEGTQVIAVKNLAGKKYMVVLSKLEKPYEQYSLLYAYSLDREEESYQQQLKFSMMIMIGTTLLLAVILFIVLTHLTQPLSKLEEQTLAIGEGDYSGRVSVQGKDEFASLAGSFNEMSSKIEDQVKKLKEEGEKKQLLIDNMAHEFRTPLTSISGYAGYLKMAAVSEDERLEALDYIISESQRLTRLSKIILDMADISRNDYEFKKIPVAALLSHVQECTSVDAADKQIEVETKWTLEEITGDETMLCSLLINLVENGIRACQEKGRVSMLVGREEGNAKIIVRDNGIGMAKEEIAKIEEPFYRIDKARSRKAGGVGLGVSLCRLIVKVHKGKMNYESEEGKGTSVYIYIPL